VSFTSWVDDRIKLAVDEAVTKAVAQVQADVKAEIGALSGQLEKLPEQIVGEVNGTLGRIEASVGGLQQFLNGLPHIPFLQ
jgi:predicted butyrate kinase (DUF1464 family)